MKRATIVGGDKSYGEFLPKSWTFISSSSVVQSDDAVIFTGGADVFPGFYGEQPLSTTYFDAKRDAEELNAWKKAKRLGVPCIGICRGAQLLCVANGGKLAQHVRGHTSNHKMRTSKGNVLSVNSTHHQMMLPNDRGIILAWAESVATEYSTEPEKKKGKFIEPEVVWYPDTKDLCIQYHPERMDYTQEALLYAHELVKKYIGE